MPTPSSVVPLLASAIQSHRRLAIPLAAVPGMQLLNLTADEVHRSGKLQFECIRALAMQTDAEVLVTFIPYLSKPKPLVRNPPFRHRQSRNRRNDRI